MKILFLTIGDECKASSRVRVFWLVELLKIDSAIITSSDGFRIFGNLFKQVKSNIFIFQKNASKYHFWSVRILKYLSKKTIFDIDDFPSPNNSEITLRNFKRMCSSVNIILAGSPELVSLCGQYNSHVYLLPSGIKLQNYSKKSLWKKNYLCIGWIGNGNHYANDLTCILEEPLKILAQRYQLKLKIVGSANNHVITDVFSKIEGLHFEHVSSLNWSNPKVIDQAMDEFDIGVYPLNETFFNSFKCGFKALEYYAKGIPVVSSNVAMNKDIVLHEKTGYIVNSIEEWIIALESLIKDLELRKQMGDAGYKHVKENYAIEKIAARFEEIVLND